MSISSDEPALPTLTRLNVETPKEVNAELIASQWFQQFLRYLENGDGEAVSTLFVDDSFWRDTLALTWHFRTFHGRDKIARFLLDVLSDSSKVNHGALVSVSKMTLNEDSVTLQRPYPDLAWIQGIFTFETSVGIGSGVFRLVPTSAGPWKAHVVYTNLERLKGFPELIGPLRSTASNHGDEWLESRQREVSFENVEPAVVVIGAGHCGLEIAARLKYLGVPTLVVERHPRVGDSWRTRYEALSLHDPVHVIHMPYLPFPSTWPLWTPSPKIADWLEYYAQALELNIWTHTNVDKIEEIGTPEQTLWNVYMTRGNGQKRVLKPRHIIFATGVFGGPARVPKFPGVGDFKGKTIHTTQYKSAKEHDGKKVVVIGSCTSAHDVTHDHAKRGIDVTMVQRGSTFIMSTEYGLKRLNQGMYAEDTPPPEHSDRLAASFPLLFTKLMHQRMAPEIAELDKELLEGLKKRGFKYNMGEDGSGVIMLYHRRGGGFYFDTGASKLIVDGKIKLKNDSTISRFTENGIEFENGSTLPADVVILATGYENAKELVRSLVNDDVANRTGTLWGLNEEGELNSMFRYCGVPGLYFTMGNFAQSRFYSKLLALQINAHEEGIFGKRYLA
ncbi:FAD/NAD-binding domain-containing protein [Fomitiporia mediterranea MF3/22]|uniref:FAD/NAD-binding domain-containing protein n=1 Tax=Fomitiporia mediterranea (strain MF3/22) TaxID=694068 RepID=UPI0004407651|nr:FAD/NAD-binding domain-containing protein [Fomitiporia mediterranea MF3/22]EJD03237.1 FAD/NAD-binding domain-containing protein [Fomitiporia mediterranea MF3/22]